MPNDVYLTPPSSAASAKLYPLMASGADLRWCIRLMQRSMRIVICDGSATAMLRRHQAAERRAAGVGWISTDTTGSMIPEASNGYGRYGYTIGYLGYTRKKTAAVCAHKWAQGAKTLRVEFSVTHK